MKGLLYSIEVLLIYVPLICMWLMGLAFGFPLSFFGAMSGEAIGIVLMFALLFGGIGLWGLVHLLKKLIWQGMDYPISKYRNHLIFGCIAVCLSAIYFSYVSWLFVFYPLLPILVTLHLYHVCKKYS